MEILHYRAFTTTAEHSGNPAGVILDARELSDADMQRIATDLGYSESAFLLPQGDRTFRVRYFSPQAEVDFCGHATVASAVAVAEKVTGAGELVFHTNVGDIPIEVSETENGFSATLASITPQTADLERAEDLLAVLGWSAEDLDPTLPLGKGFAGLWHPVLWAGSRERLAALDYDFDGLRALMLEQNWGTISLLFRESPALIHARNAFPIGGVVEDPATGAAAAALGGFLRAQSLLPADGRFTILQGEDMGQPCLLHVDSSGNAAVRVGGTGGRFLP